MTMIIVHVFIFLIFFLLFLLFLSFFLLILLIFIFFRLSIIEDLHTPCTQSIHHQLHFKVIRWVPHK